MKKCFALIAMASLLFACGDNSDKGGSKNEGPNVAPDFESLITIDGDFSDWDALDASKVATAELAPLPVGDDALLKVKVYADEVFLSVYLEFDEMAIAERSAVPFHVYLNADNDPTTGGGEEHWSDVDAEYLLEGFIMENEEFCSYDPWIFAWHGMPNVVDWDWGTEDEAILQGGGGAGKGAGVGNAYELQVIRDMVPGPWHDTTFTVGFDIQQNWSTVGHLPIETMTDENMDGVTTKLVVTIDK